MSEYSPKAAKRNASEAVVGTSEALVDFLAKWDQTLTDFQPVDLDFTGYKEVQKALPAKATNETQIATLQRLGPVLNLGVEQGAGPLLPVAHVTSRDLLGFGWEMACSLSSVYYETLNQPSANPESAKSVVSSVLGAIKGANLFFGDNDAKALAALDSPARVQYVGSPHAQRALFKKLPASWTSTPEMPLKRQWLNRTAVREALTRMVEAKASDGIFKENVERLLREGGPSIAQVLSASEPAPQYAELVDRLGLREKIAGELPDFAAGDLAALQLEIKSAASSSLSSSPSTEVPEKLDYSKFKTAEEFWAALEKLREMPRRSANSPQDRMLQIRQWLQSRHSAANAFIKAYPNDPHRHTAKLMAVDSSLQLARFGEEGISKIDSNELEAIAECQRRRRSDEGRSGVLQAYGRFAIGRVQLSTHRAAIPAGTRPLP
jgi:hypothetical protein